MKNAIKLFILILCLTCSFGVATAKTLQGPVLGNVSSLYGLRHHPVYGFTKFHHGIDIAAPAGAPVYAVQDGVVSKSGWNGGYGLAVTIDHNYPDIPAIPRVNTTYGHCSYLYAKPGDRIRRGQVIALVGSTGLSTGPHLHFEVRYKGSPVDPIDYLEKLPSYLNYIAKYRGLSKNYKYVSSESKYY